MHPCLWLAKFLGGGRLSQAGRFLEPLGKLLEGVFSVTFELRNDLNCSKVPNTNCCSNVREWIADAWHENHLRAPLEGQARSPAKSLPLALRVTKGGACSSAAQTWAFEWFATSKAGAIIDRLHSIECQCARFQKRSLAPKNGRLASEVMMTAVYRIDSKSDITVQRDTRALCTLNKMLLT